jgi:hypothetical protein
VYGNNPSQGSREIQVSVRLLSETGQEVFAADDTIAAGRRRSGSWDIGGRIQLEELPPGRYLLRVQAQLVGDEPLSVARETLVTVVP